MGIQQQEQQQQAQSPWLCNLLEAEFECIKGKKRQNSSRIASTRKAISKKEGECHQGMGHTATEVLKCSGCYSLKSADIERLSLYSSDIHELIVNHKRVICLNSRQHRDGTTKKRNVGKSCTVCEGTLDAGLFCSLGCKFTNNKGKVSSMEHKESGDGEIGIQIPIPKRPRTKRIPREKGETKGFRTRRRKKKPMRSPLF